LKKIEQELFPFISEISITGYGEPMLSKSFKRIVESAKKNRIKVFFFTNATLLDKQMAEFLVEKSVDEITVSLDGATKKTFEKIRRNANFERVIENTRRLSQIKKESGVRLPRIRVEFVTMRQNIEELPEMPALAKSLGAEELKATHLAVFDKRFEKQSLVFEPDLLHKKFEQTKANAGKIGIKLDLPVDFSKEFDNEVPPCLIPWVHAYIRFDGKVQVCCWFEDAVMGDLNKQSFEEIWNSERYQKFRESVNSKRPPMLCLFCENRFRYLKNKNFRQTYLKMRPRKK
jgi:radical SAM protein with 4Fe4S-binding SPASM domain